MKNIIKFVAATALMSTAAFAEVGTDWKAADTTFNSTTLDSADTPLFTAAAVALEFYLMGAELTEFTGQVIVEGRKLVPESIKVRTYSPLQIQAEINNVKAALEEDIYGDGIDADGNDNGILGDIATEVVEDIADVRDSVTDFKDATYEDGGAYSAALATLISEIDALNMKVTNYNLDVDAAEAVINNIVFASGGYPDEELP